MGRGERILLMDNAGWEYEVELTQTAAGLVEGTVCARREAPPEPSLRLTLYQGLLRGKKFDWVVQKGTELGIAAFVPLLSERCVGGLGRDAGRRLERWREIAREAAEQCRRGRLPELREPMSLREACCQKGPEPALLLWEGQAASLRAIFRERFGGQRPQRLALFVGPEGGFSPQEVELARSQGLVPISLGQRILRSETAGLIGAALLLYEAGDLGGGLG
jgi:16S rRNA (uracil1498-N3)-methyltransferase